MLVFVSYMIECNKFNPIWPDLMLKNDFVKKSG